MPPETAVSPTRPLRLELEVSGRGQHGGPSRCSGISGRRGRAANTPVRRPTGDRSSATAEPPWVRSRAAACLRGLARLNSTGPPRESGPLAPSQSWPLLGGSVGSIFLASSRARALARRQIAVPDRCQSPRPRGRPCARAGGRQLRPLRPKPRQGPRRVKAGHGASGLGSAALRGHILSTRQSRFTTRRSRKSTSQMPRPTSA
jgi:hypothetical protein